MAYYDKNRNKYAARITIDGKRIWYGRYDTLAEAQWVERKALSNEQPKQSLFSRWKARRVERKRMRQLEDELSAIINKF